MGRSPSSMDAWSPARTRPPRKRSPEEGRRSAGHMASRAGGGVSRLACARRARWLGSAERTVVYWFVSINYELLRTFLEVATSDTFSRAAARRHVTPSAVSQQIRTLEGQLGMQLFERFGRRARLTEGGAQLAASVKEHFAGIDLALTEASEKPGLVRGTIRIGAPGPFSGSGCGRGWWSCCNGTRSSSSKSSSTSEIPCWPAASSRDAMISASS